MDREFYLEKKAIALLFALCAVACKSSSVGAEASKQPQAVSPNTQLPAGAVATAASAAAVERPVAGGSATVGQPAPDFRLPDLDGQLVSLSQFKGKRVVLEWFNPQCPFVKAAHTKGSLVDAAEQAVKDGVVWLAINSGAPGKQGHGVEASRTGQQEFGIKHPILIDEDGHVGRSYGATNTPHLFVIDEQGVLVYAGAVDNSPDGEGQSPTGGSLVSYVAQALGDLKAGRAVSISQTKAYGCGVKYAVAVPVSH